MFSKSFYIALAVGMIVCAIIAGEVLMVKSSRGSGDGTFSMGSGRYANHTMIIPAGGGDSAAANAVLRNRYACLTAMTNYVNLELSAGRNRAERPFCINERTGEIIPYQDIREGR